MPDYDQKVMACLYFDDTRNLPLMARMLQNGRETCPAVTRRRISENPERDNPSGNGRMPINNAKRHKTSETQTN